MMKETGIQVAVSHTRNQMDHSFASLSCLKMHKILIAINWKSILNHHNMNGKMLSNIMAKMEVNYLVNLSKMKKFLLRYQLRSEEHTSELQSRDELVCRLLLEKKKK